LNTLAQLTIFV